METPIIVFCMDNSAFMVAMQDGSLTQGRGEGVRVESERRGEGSRGDY
jgi:hypothetical protein